MSDAQDKAIIARVVQAISGVCRYCGCAGDSCDLPTGGGDKCCFTDALRTLCSNPDCQARAMKEKSSRRWAKRRADRKAGRRAA